MSKDYVKMKPGNNAFRIFPPADDPSPPTHVEPLQLVVIDFRVPKKHELYRDKNGYIQRLRFTNYAKHAQPRLILKEEWLVKREDL